MGAASWSVVRTSNGQMIKSQEKWERNESQKSQEKWERNEPPKQTGCYKGKTECRMKKCRHRGAKGGEKGSHRG